MSNWTFLTNHGRVLTCIARDPGARLRDIAASVSITERRAHAIVADLVEAGYVVKIKDGRRNRYEIQAHLPLPESVNREHAIGDVLDVLTGTGAGRGSKQQARGGGRNRPPEVTDEDREAPRQSPRRGAASQ